MSANPKTPNFAIPPAPPFAPTDDMLKAKTAYWIRVGSLPSAECSATTVAAMLDDPRVREWWNKPGFAAWFKIRTSWEERAEYLAHKALDKAEELLNDSDPKAASAQVNLIKAIIEFSNRQPAKIKETKVLDADINRLDKQQLKEFIRQKSALLETPDGSTN